MPRRIKLIMLSVLLLAATAAAGCGSDPGPVPGVAGGFGTDPVVTVPSGRPPAQLFVQTVIPGHGPVVQRGDYVLFNVQGKVWAGDREVVDSYTDRQPQGLPLDSQAALPAWRHLAGQRVGSRVLMVVPPRDGFGRRGDPQANVMGSDTLIFVFDLLGAVPQHGNVAGGTQAYRPGPGLPAVTWTARGPAITVPEAARPPARMVRDVLVRGHGRPVRSGDTVVVQDTGVVWRIGQGVRLELGARLPGILRARVRPGDPRLGGRAGRPAGGQPGAPGAAAEPRLRPGRESARRRGARHPRFRDRHSGRRLTRVTAALSR